MSADLLAALQVCALPCKVEQARADVDLYHGLPPRRRMALVGLDGTAADLASTKGRLLNVNATTSASRVFGLIDLDNLRRRLKGDFSDVLKRGLSFDKR
jgi:uncharacterized protein YhdP